MKQFSKELGKVSITPKGDWNSNIANEKLDIVYDRRNNQAYIAKQDVPIGVDIDNREYWQPLNVSGYADNNFINLTAENENGTITAYESLEEAVATIFPINRRVGATLSFYNLNSDRLDRQAEFELWQFNSTDLANWENRDYWNNIYYNWNVFAGWYIDADALKNHVEIPNVGQYAYVGSNLNDAILYQCRTNGTWTNTGIKVRNYISVVVSGNITIGENGNWFSDGKDTGIPATPSVDEQLDDIITKHESLSRTVQGIAVTGGASTATNVTYNNYNSELNAENAQDAIDELQSSKIDKTSILQEAGDAEDKVMSQKATSTELTKKADKTAVEAEAERAQSAEQAIIYDITEVSLDLGKTKAKIPIKSHSEDALYFTDSKGYVIAKIDKDGIQSVGNKTPTLDDKYKTWLYGKTIWGIGTSQWANGIVLSTLANATGAIYYNDKCNDVNHFTISGGTYYLTPNKGTCARLRNLLWWKEQGESIDAIFFMIGNDTIPTIENEIGTIDDAPYFVTEEFTSDYVAESWDDLRTVVVNNISLYVGEHTPKVGAACMAKYKERYSKAVLSVNSLPTSNGNCAIMADGFAYQFNVSPDDSIETIINNIAITSYEGYSTSVNSENNTITFTRNEETSDSNISFEDTDGTGLTLDIQLTKDVSEYMVCYIAKDTSIEAWNTSSNWTYNSHISYISKIKGLLEYITANFKGSELFYVDMNGYDWRKSEDYWYANGTINYSKYYKSKLESIDKRAELLKEYCKRYAIKYIDIDHTCGFNVANIMDYFPERGVHPNTKGYKIWGQALLLNVIK